jgi:uncharacterized protein (DUF2252 family)
MTSPLDPRLDPFALAARQAEIDADAMRTIPWLAERKRTRLSPAPFAFFRGSAPLFYEILAVRPDLAGGPAGDGFIVGDMHLENVGAYRNDADEVVFGLNDFDDASIGPLRYDVLRFSTSVLLAGRAFHASGVESIGLVEHALASYLKARSGLVTGPRRPASIDGLIEKVGGRTRRELLDDRAPLVHGRRSFVRGDRYRDLSPDIEARVPALLEAYVRALGDRAPAHAGAWRIEDAAFRIAGNGSLGVLRVAILVIDHEGDRRLVELKECHEPSPSALFAPPAGHWSHPAERCVAAARALCVAPPRLLAPIESEGLSFVGRRLFPQEDKLAVEEMRFGPELEAVVGFIAYLLGESHARGVHALAKAVGGADVAAFKPWTGAEVSGLVDSAVVLAGVLEGVYLAWSRRHAAG